MTKAIPTIQRYMTTTPATIGKDQTISSAAQVMREHRIRHLPVLEAGQIVGILTERDIALVERLKDVDPTTTLVEDAMTDNPYTTHPDAPITEVTSHMAEHKYGAAVVVQNHKVVGIFTTVDACRMVTELFETRLK